MNCTPTSTPPTTLRPSTVLAVVELLLVGCHQSAYRILPTYRSEVQAAGFSRAVIDLKPEPVISVPTW
jgi:hypothetical protein